MYAVPQDIQTRVFARLPDHLRITDRTTSWIEGRQHVRPTCYLEGPSVARNGDLYCTDIPYGRIFRITPDGTFHVVVEYDGEPNGLKFHKDGRLFVTDHRRGLLAIDPASGNITPILERAYSEGFKGVNDLCFSMSGDVYFTDQGQTGLQDPTGKVYKLHADGKLSCIMSGIPSPNGLVLNKNETALYVNVTRANSVWRLPLMEDDRIAKAGVFLNLSGGLSGPDGIAADADGGVAVAHSGMGTIWIFDRLGEPKYRVRSCTGLRTTNLAYGGADNRTLYITESETGTILAAEVPVPGAKLFSHS